MLKDKLKVHGIKRRWMLNGVLMIILIVIVAVATVSVFVAGYYFSSVRTGLESKAKTATDFFNNYIIKTYEEYYDNAYKYTQQFEDASTIELQVLNSDGMVEISSYSVTSGYYPGTSDVTTAIETGKMATWTGKNPSTGEHIMAVSAPVMHVTGQVVGVMRYVTTLSNVYKEIAVNIAVTAGIGIAVILLVIYTNMTLFMENPTPN